MLGYHYSSRLFSKFDTQKSFDGAVHFTLRRNDSLADELKVRSKMKRDYRYLYICEIPKITDRLDGGMVTEDDQTEGISLVKSKGVKGVLYKDVWELSAEDSVAIFNDKHIKILFVIDLGSGKRIKVKDIRDYPYIDKGEHRGLVISAFFGSGKSTVTNNLMASGIEVVDLDSSKFSHIIDGHGNVIDNKDFPNNYINEVKRLLDSKDCIFVSSHKEVREGLQEAKIQYLMVYPALELRGMWLDRLRHRTTGQNDEGFVQYIEDNWDSWIKGIIKDKSGYQVSYEMIADEPYMSVDFVKGVLGV